MCFYKGEEKKEQNQINKGQNNHDINILGTLGAPPKDTLLSNME